MISIGSLFTGFGGLDLAAESVLGGRTIWTSEIDRGACKIIAERFPEAPNLGDITKIKWEEVPRVDALTGGFPCQDLSQAGRRAGLGAGTRSGLWSAMAEAIGALRPQLVIIENVRGILSGKANREMESDGGGLAGGASERALGRVLGDLACLGYDADWCGLPASAVGAPHNRYRIFIIASPGDADRSDLYRRSASRQQGEAGSPARSAADADDLGAAPPDSGGQRHQGPLGQGADSGKRSDPYGCGPQPSGRDRGAWGEFEQIIERWEMITAWPAPPPTQPGVRGPRPRLSPWAVEWMMGLPPGWVCGVPALRRSEALRCLGGGVVPQQAAAAIALLLEEAAA